MDLSKKGVGEVLCVFGGTNTIEGKEVMNMREKIRPTIRHFITRKDEKYFRVTTEIPSSEFPLEIPSIKVVEMDRDQARKVVKLVLEMHIQQEERPSVKDVLDGKEKFISC